MRSFVFVGLACSTLVACQKSNLTYATSTGAQAAEAIYREQAIDNFSNLLERPNSVPSQVTIPVGTMQTNSTLTPSITFPLSAMLAHQISSTATGLAVQDTKTTAGGGATLQASQSFQLNYNVSPVNDPLQLRNLRAMYIDVLCNSPSTDKNIVCAAFSFKAAYMLPRLVTEDNTLTIDPYYIYAPQCVLCLPDNNGIGTLVPPTTQAQTRAEIDSLVPARVFADPWLYWEGAGSIALPKPDAVYIGSADGRRFYASSEAEFGEFLLAIYPPPTSPPRGKPAADHGPAAPGAPQQVVPNSSEGGKQVPFVIIPQGILPAPP